MTTRHLFRTLLALPLALLALAPAATHAAPSVSGAWTMTGSMHVARSYQTATLLLNGEVLEAGGDNTNGWLASAELYHPSTGTWTITGSMHQARGQNTATLLRDGRVLVVGGCDSNGGDCTSLTASAELYNPKTGTWTVTGSMHEPRWGHTATLLPSGRVLVAGGSAADCGPDGCASIQASAELYDPRTGDWTLTGSMHQARAFHTAALLPSGQVLVAGGTVATAAGATHPLAGAELYNPQTGTWALTGSMHRAGSGQAATLLPNGLVLVNAGPSANGHHRNAELYHPHSGSWATTGSLLHDSGYVTGQTVALLHSGKVLVVGGSLTNHASAELYDPQTGAWTLTGSLHDAFLYAQPMTLLASGQVLVAGGSQGNDQSTAVTSAELYNP
ncbi:MAG TPA: kelch repeat-containing protein [Chloroflexota bacterium]|jgi:hypothetical protein